MGEMRLARRTMESSAVRQGQRLQRMGGRQRKFLRIGVRRH